nr:IS1 family transposase [Serratia sp. DD3]
MCDLFQLLLEFNVTFWCTGGYRAYKDALPTAKHIVGKLYTQHIERENLTLSNRLKRLNRNTSVYSRSSCKPGRIIGTLMEREYYV